MEPADAGSFGFDGYESIGVEDIAEREEVLLVMGPEKSGKTNFIRALYLASDARNSYNSFDRPASNLRQRTIDTASNARYKITEAHRLHSKHLPEIESGTGERKQIESVVVLECSSEYYSSEDPQSYDPLLDLLRQKRCRIGVLICGNIISGSPAPSQELVDRLSDRTDLQNLTLVETNWDRATIWRDWEDSAYHTRMVEGPWKDLVAFTHTSIAQYDNKKSPALDAWRIVFNTLRTDLKGSDIVILIMGPTGAGKSSFIRAATGLPDVKVGYGLKSETKWVSAWTSKKTEGGRRVVYIDTPGFDDTEVPDPVVLERIATWLHLNLTNSIPISGILYFHSIAGSVTMTPVGAHNLAIFQEFCGYNNSDFAQRIRFVTTMWDEVQPSDGERRLEELCKTWWAKMLNKGAQHCGLRRKGEPSTEAMKDITSAVIINSTLPVSLSTPRDTIQSVLVQGGDIVTLVVGPDEIGKNAFIRAATGQAAGEVGFALKSKTHIITAWTAKNTEGGRRLVYIDTPGFVNTSARVQEVVDWLHQNLTTTIPIFAILYFHRIGDATTSMETGVKNLQLFQQRCGFDEFDFYQRLSFVTTNWDTVGLSEGYARLKELRKCWAPMIKKGAKQRALKEPGEPRSPSTRIVQDVAMAVINSTPPAPSLSLRNLPVTFQSSDIVILIIGPFGSGKSAFIRAATGQPNVEVGDGLKPKTETITVWTAKNTEGGRRVVYVDTPGFDKTSARDSMVKVAEWVRQNFADAMSISAILYFHRIDDVAEARTDRTSVQPLELLQQHCALTESQFYPRVFLTTTMWDVVDPSTGDRHLKELREGCWAVMIGKGAQECALRQHYGLNVTRHNHDNQRPSTEAVQRVVPSALSMSPRTLNSSSVSDVVRAVVDSASSMSSPYMHSSSKIIQSSDIVIVIMGHTGTGKSSFISAATRDPDIQIGHTNKSETQCITAWAAKKGSRRRIVYIDTPGFDDTNGKRDSDTLAELTDWLHNNLPNKTPISSILYFHRISNRTNMTTDTAVQNLGKFCEYCDFNESDFSRRVVFVTTMWDELTPSEGNRRLKELRGNWAPMIEKGAQECQITGEESAGGNGSGVDLQQPTTGSVNDVVQAVVGIDSVPSLYIKSSHMTTIQSGDIVILIIGPSRSGKSSFVHEAIDRSHVQVGHDKGPKTRGPTTYFAKRTAGGRRVVYIDTPGFENKTISDSRAITKIVDWLHTNLPINVPISAILYFHQITNSMSAAAARNLGLFQERYGFEDSEFSKRLAFVTTMWDNVAPSESDRRLKELCDKWWKFLEKGAQVHSLRQKDGNRSRNPHTDGPSIDSIQDVVQSVVQSASNASSKTLNSSRTAIQNELQQGKGALNTAAARVLYKQTGIQKKRLEEIVTKLQEEVAAITDDVTLKVMLREELDDALQELALVANQESELVKGGARKNKFIPWG